MSATSKELTIGDLTDLPVQPPHGKVGLVISVSIVVAGVSLLIWVVVRNQPFRDAISPQIIRVLLALTAGWGVYSLPGQLGFAFAGQGQSVTASSALAAFALTYLGTPAVIPTLDMANVVQPPPAIVPTRAWAAREYLLDFTTSKDAHLRRNEWLRTLLDPYDRGQLYGRTIVCESAPFPRPYDAFNALVQTVPAKKGSGGHKVHGFLVRGTGDGKTFVPLLTLYAFTDSDQRAVIAVPPSAKGDYLLLVVLLQPDGDLKYTDGKSFPLQLHRL